MIRRPFALVLAPLTMLLAGCAQPPAWPWDDAPARPQASAPRLEAPPAPRPAPQATQRQAKAPDLKALRPAPRPAGDKDEAEPAAAPLKLVGLSEDETADLLGRPAEENAEPPGKIWVYKAAGCRLSVHLFPDMEKGGFYALDYTSAEGPKETCLGRIAGEARKKGSALVAPGRAAG